jgi:transposase
VLNGIFWICRTGAPWRDLPAEFGNANSVWRQFRRWRLSGVWNILPQALAGSGGEVDLLQMIESTMIRAHRCAAGQKGGIRIRRLAVREVAFQPKLTSAPTLRTVRYSVNKAVYALRSRIECLIGHRKEQRRIAP